MIIKGAGNVQPISGWFRSLHLYMSTGIAENKDSQERFPIKFSFKKGLFLCTQVTNRSSR